MKRLFLRGLCLAVLLLAVHPLQAGEARPSLTLGKIHQKGTRYEIRTLFPKLAWPARPEVARAFNRASRQPVDKAVTDFRRELATSLDDRPDVPWDLVSVWDTHHKDSRLVSGVLTFGAFTGGAHPNPWLVSLNFDLKGGRPLSLAQVFRPGSGYLEALSRLCLRELAGRNAPEAGTGAAPEAANFQVWTISVRGLSIHFPPYQVAPYSEGVQEVLIPWSEVADLLRPGGLAAPLAGLRS